MFAGRRVHEHIRAQIKLALAGRPLKWLAEDSGVPQSTLSGQMLRPKFSLEVLLRVANALEREVAFFLPDDRSVTSPPQTPAAELLGDLEAMIAALRVRYSISPSNGPPPENGYRVPRSDVG